MTLKAGIIGLGVGEAHIEGYRSHPNCEVVMLCDMSEEKREEAKKKYPEMKITAEAEELLLNPDIDLVSIASYDNDHYAQAVKSIEQGKHVFIEKPVCTDEKHAKHLYEMLNEKKSLQISSNLILRRYPRFRRLKEMFQKGELGDIFLIEGDYNYGRLEKITEGWRGQLGFYSVIYGGGIHIIDLMLWLTEDEVVEVSAYGNNIASKGTQFQFNDLVVCILKFKSGLVGKMAVNFGCVYPHFHNFSVYGTKGSFVNTPEGAKHYESRDPRIAPTFTDDEYPGVKKGAMLYSFVESICNSGNAEVTKEEVFKAMAVCFAIEKSMQTSEPVQVQYFKG